MDLIQNADYTEPFESAGITQTIVQWLPYERDFQEGAGKVFHRQADTRQVCQTRFNRSTKVCLVLQVKPADRRRLR